MSSRLLRFAVALVALAATTRARAYSLTGSRWTGSSTTMQLQLGAGPGALLDGSASWGAAAEDALTTWNGSIGSFRFNIVRDSTAAKAGGNRTNNVMFASDVYGTAWGTGVLAVTLTYTSGPSHTETDVLFNNGLTWNSYRGPLRYSGVGAAIYDFHRVALHEFGHALGLDHPDEAGQSVTAIMNSRISSLDALAADDIAGAQALYGAPAGAVVIAPAISAQPASATVTAGQGASFTVTANGTAPFTYQWRKNGNAIAGASAATLTFGTTTTADSGSYSVVVSNSAGSVTSNAATLTVNAPASIPTAPPPATPTPTAPATPAVIAPAITTQPAAQTSAVGGTATFSVAASGTGPLSYQWRKNGTPITGANATTLTLAHVQAADEATYSVLVWNSAASVPSSGAALTVLAPPAFTASPADQSVLAGARVVLTAVATGTAPLTYQWRKDGTAIAGATGATLTIASAQPADAGSYVVVVTNTAGSAASTAARVTVTGLPAIATQPLALTVAAGERATFSVAVNAVGSVSYQWLKDGAEIPGATSATLTLDSARPADGASYTVRITNAAGSTLSAAATLTVKFSRLVNLSTRGFVPAGGALTPGFYIRGANAKALLVRGVGPTLSIFGVGTALGATKLDVIAQDSATVVASNNTWGGTSALRDAFASVGAFPLAADSKDAAVETSLPPRAYSVRIAPGDGAISGITLAEIYDVDPITATSSQLVNVSTLGFVGSGDQVLTAGFVISGNAPKRLLIRAVGPGLAPFGIGDFLRDPQLGLVPLGRSEPIATNDDWPDVVGVRSAFTAAGAFALPAGSKDAALVITLEPGAYTVIVSGVSATDRGNALVEIYDLDP